MQFIWPSALLLLLIVPVLLGAYVWAQRRRQRFALRYSSIWLVKDALGRGPGIRRHIPPLVFLLGLAVMFVAFARPYTVATLPSLESTVILTIDVSRSMLAEDLKPNRIEAAKAAARQFVERQTPNTQIGIVSFSGNAALNQVPTTDKDAAIAAINRLTTQRATAIGSGILMSLDAIAEATGADLPPLAVTTPFSRTPSFSLPTPTPLPKGVYAPAIIILLTDGQNTTGPSPSDAAQIAANRGVRVYTVGVGTAQGATLGGGGGFGGGGFGGGGFGFRTELDETTLRKISKMTDAKYYHASDEKDLQAIYEGIDKQLVFKPQPIEMTAGFTAVAAVFLLIGGVLSLLWFNRLP